MTTFAPVPHTVSVTEAASRGVSSLIRSAEHGDDVLVGRHGKPVAAIVGVAHLAEITRLEQDLRDSVLLFARLSTDRGHRGLPTPPWLTSSHCSDGAIPQVVRWALKKCLLLERDPEAGAALRGSLAGFRKLVVGDRDWRLLWRVTLTILGWQSSMSPGCGRSERSESEVYTEVRDRVEMVHDQPHTIPLAEALAALSGATDLGLLHSVGTVIRS